MRCYRWGLREGEGRGAAVRSRRGWRQRWAGTSPNWRCYRWGLREREENGRVVRSRRGRRQRWAGTSPSLSGGAGEGGSASEDLERLEEGWQEIFHMGSEAARGLM